MTEPELEELVRDCPTLFHMAQAGSWPAIAERGLLSTTALLDLYEVEGAKREGIEAQRRPTSIVVEREGLPRAVIRDQIPMDDAGLLRALPAHLSPSDWYKILNRKVFFWFTRERLLKLLCAGAYRDDAHDVLEVETARLIPPYREQIWFCPMNSGCTKPMPHPRDETAFRRIPDYPYSDWRRKRRRGERVVELAVDYGVPDIIKYTDRVVRMQRDQEQQLIFAS